MNVVGATANLIYAIFSIYSVLVVARFMLQLAGADFYNPISQAVAKATRVPCAAMRKVIPPFGKFDTASFVWLIVVQLIMVCTIHFFEGTLASYLAIPVTLVLEALAATALAILNFWLFAIFIEIIGSWISMGQYNPFLDLVSQVNRPIMEPIRRVIPPLGGLDLSPIVAVLGISFIKNVFGL